jgi:hypothetical protein
MVTLSQLLMGKIRMPMDSKSEGTREQRGWDFSVTFV